MMLRAPRSQARSPRAAGERRSQPSRARSGAGRLPPCPSRRIGAATLLAWVLCMMGAGACASAAPGAERPITPSPRSEPISFEFPSVGEEAVVSSATTRGRATALVFVTTFDITSQLVARRVADVLVAFTPRANAAAVVVEAPAYAELVPAYREALALPYPVVMADFATQQGAGPFGNISHVPTLVVLDRDGREVVRHEGSIEPDEIRAALRRASSR